MATLDLYARSLITTSPLQTPRLIFQVLTPDLTSQFFVAYFSQGGRRLTLINPPGHIDLSIGAMLKDVLRSKISADYVVDENIRVIEVRKKAGGFAGMPNLFRLINHSEPLSVFRS